MIFAFIFLLIFTCFVKPSQLAFMSRLKNQYKYMATTDVIVLPEDYELDDLKLTSTTDVIPEIYYDDNTHTAKFWEQTYFGKTESDMEFEKPIFTRKDNIQRYKYSRTDKFRLVTTTTAQRIDRYKTARTDQYFNEVWPAIPPHFAQTRSSTELLTTPSPVTNPTTINVKTWRSYFPAKTPKRTEIFFPIIDLLQTTQKSKQNVTWKFYTSTEAADYETPYSAEVADYETPYSAEITDYKRPYSVDMGDYKNILYSHDPHEVQLASSKKSENTDITSQTVTILPDPALILRAKPPPSFYEVGNKTNRCYRCGLNENELSTATCYRVFDQPSMIDRHKRRHYKTTCSGKGFIGGCYKRYLDVGDDYNERGCRRVPPEPGSSFASHRFLKLELLLIGVREGCAASPVASLVPLSRPISLYVRFHVCVCVNRLCNNASILSGRFFNSLLYILFTCVRIKCS